MNRLDPDVALTEWFDKVEPSSVPPGILESALAVTRRSDQRRGMSGRVAAMLAGDVPQGTGIRAANRRLLAATGFAGMGVGE